MGVLRSTKKKIKKILEPSSSALRRITKSQRKNQLFEEIHIQFIRNVIVLTIAHIQVLKLDGV